MVYLALFAVWCGATLLPLLLFDARRRSPRCPGRGAGGSQVGRGALAAALLILGLLLAHPPGAAAFTTYTVTRTDDPVPGSCLAADCSLREAVLAANANPGSLISIPAGTYNLTRTGTLDTPQVGDLDLTATTTISGAGAATTIIDAGDVDRIFDIPVGPFVYIAGLSLRDGTGKQSGLAGVGQFHGHGGAIHNHGTLILVASTISESTPAAFQPDGGGLYNAGGATALLENVTIARNNATSGGGVGNAGTLDLYNVTITANAATTGGGLTAGGTARLNNTIVGGNTADTAPDCSGTVAPATYSLFQSTAGCTLGGGSAGNRTGVAPLLTPIATAGYVALYSPLIGSQAIDTGTGTDCPSKDERGVTRPWDGNGNGVATCDIGAYEYTGPDLAISYLADSPDPVEVGQLLIYTIDVANRGPLAATELRLTDTLPSGVTYSSYVETRGGSCAHTAGTVTCDLASLNDNFVWTIYLYVEVNPTAAGPLTNHASVVVAGGDPEPANNTMTENTTVTTVTPSASPTPSPTPSPAPATFALTVASTGAGGVTPGGGSYVAGDPLTLTPLPAADNVFIGWTVDGVFRGWADPLTLTMNANHTVVAAFAARQTFGDAGPQVTGATEAIARLAARGIIKGCDQAANPPLFCPTAPTLRAQMAALIVRAMGWSGETPGNPFPDQNGVDNELWQAVATLAAHGVAQGYGDGTYGTTDPVLNAQVVSFVTRAMVERGYWAFQPDDNTIYPDVPPGSGHRRDLVTYVHYAGPVRGASDPTASFIGWDQPASRAWFSFVLWQALDSYFGVDQVGSGGYIE